MSLAQRWKQRVKNGEAGQASAPTTAATTGDNAQLGKAQLLSLLDAGLKVAIKALKAMKSKKDKVAHKRDQLVPEFIGYVNRLMDQGWEHPLLPWYTVWSLDAGSMEKALQVAKYCIEKGLELDKEYFKRDIPTIVADLVHKWSEQSFRDGHCADPYFSEVYDLVTTASGTDTWAMPDEVQAKYYKLKGQIEYQAGNLEAAQDNFQKGLALGATVKTVLAEVTKELEAAKEAETDDGTGDGAK